METYRNSGKVISCISAALLIYSSTTSAEISQKNLMQEAMIDPSGQALEAYLQSLPRDADEYYIVDGDLRLTRQEVIKLLLFKRKFLPEVTNPTPAESSVKPELLISLDENDNPSCWSKDARARLTYAVDASSFPSSVKYKNVVEYAKEAASEWESACPNCGIKFVHVTEADVAPSVAQASGSVMFVVRYAKLNNASAVAFFPDWPRERRIVDVDPSLWNSPRPTGIMTHELGHVLGFRHEQNAMTQAGVWGVPGCELSLDPTENGQIVWKVLTSYDSKSVMHYPCGGASNPQMTRSDGDVEGIQNVYGPDSTLVCQAN